MISPRGLVCLSYTFFLAKVFRFLMSIGRRIRMQQFLIVIKRTHIDFMGIWDSIIQDISFYPIRFSVPGSLYSNIRRIEYCSIFQDATWWYLLIGHKFLYYNLGFFPFSFHLSCMMFTKAQTSYLLSFNLVSQFHTFKYYGLLILSCSLDYSIEMYCRCLYLNCLCAGWRRESFFWVPISIKSRIISAGRYHTQYPTSEKEVPPHTLRWYWYCQEESFYLSHFFWWQSSQMTLMASIKAYYDKKIAERQTHYHSLDIAPANLPESSEICWLMRGNEASANGAIYQYSLNAKAASSHICHHTSSSSCSRLLLKPPRKICSLAPDFTGAS